MLCASVIIFYFLSFCIISVQEANAFKERIEKRTAIVIECEITDNHTKTFMGTLYTVSYRDYFYEIALDNQLIKNHHLF